MVDMHHIISDGVSQQVLREDFLAFYEGKELPPLRIQYKDFAQWQNSPKEIEQAQPPDDILVKRVCRRDTGIGNSYRLSQADKPEF